MAAEQLSKEPSVVSVGGEEEERQKGTVDLRMNLTTHCYHDHDVDDDVSDSPDGLSVHHPLGTSKEAYQLQKTLIHR